MALRADLFVDDVELALDEASAKAATARALKQFEFSRDTDNLESLQELANEVDKWAKQRCVVVRRLDRYREHERRPRARGRGRGEAETPPRRVRAGVVVGARDARPGGRLPDGRARRASVGRARELARLVVIAAKAEACDAHRWCKPLGDLPGMAAKLLELSKRATRDEAREMRLALLAPHSCLDGELAAAASGGALKAPNTPTRSATCSPPHKSCSRARRARARDALYPVLAAARDPRRRAPAAPCSRTRRLQADGPREEEGVGDVVARARWAYKAAPL